jgi:hypothetical protein
VKVIFNVNVVLDVYATERTRLRKAMREAGLQEVRSASTSRAQKSSRWIEMRFLDRIKANRLNFRIYEMS